MACTQNLTGSHCILHSHAITWVNLDVPVTTYGRLVQVTPPEASGYISKPSPIYSISQYSIHVVKRTQGTAMKAASLKKKKRHTRAVLGMVSTYCSVRSYDSRKTHTVWGQLVRESITLSRDIHQLSLVLVGFQIHSHLR